MIRVNVICEGPTEEQFVKRLLAPHLQNHGVIATPRSIGTGTNFAKLRHHVVQWLKAEKTAWVTTLIDLYAMPDEFPAKTATKHLQWFLPNYAAIAS